MKRKMIAAAALIVLVICMSGCGKSYDDVKTALMNDTWYYNGGGDTILNSISFDEEEASISQVYIDGNGLHENGTNSFAFTIDDENITIELSEDESQTIPYTMDGETLKLGEGYMTAKEIDEGLQGCWKFHKSDVILGMHTENEHNILIENGMLTSESAAKANGGGSGEYFYYGPYSGSYTLGFGAFETEMMHGSDWFFNIIDGKPVVLHFDNKCTPCDKLPGEKGYKF